jgi:hypothetical protein
MRRLNFLFSIIAAFVLLPAALAGATAQDTLPPSFATWTATSPETAVPAGSLLASPAILQEYGLADAWTRSYSRGTDALQVILYRLKDPTGAYGLYSYLRSSGLREGSIRAYPPQLTVFRANGEFVSYKLSPYAQKGDFHRADVTDHSVIAPGRALILDGSFVLDVLGPTIAGTQAADLQSLVPNPMPDHTQPSTVTCHTVDSLAIPTVTYWGLRHCTNTSRPQMAIGLDLAAGLKRKSRIIELTARISLF